MNSIVKEKIPQLVELCKKYRVERMYLFGSAARDTDFNPATSDFDFLVAFSADIPLLDYADHFFELMWALDELFGRQVDLLTEKQLKNPYLIESINRDKQLIYEAAWHPQCLRDIRESIDTIEEHLTRIMGERRDFNIYMQDKLLRQGVERNLEIIGEATNRIRQTDPSFVLANSRSIVDLRNRVIHGYDNLEDQTIWGIAVKHLPLLKAEVERLLAE